MSRGRSYNSFYCFPFSVLQVCLKARVVKKLTCFRTVCGFFVKKDLWSISPHTISTERRVVIISTSIKKLGTSLIKSGAFIDVVIVTWLFTISNVHFHYTKLKVTSFSNDVKKIVKLLKRTKLFCENFTSSFLVAIFCLIAKVYVHSYSNYWIIHFSFDAKVNFSLEKVQNHAAKRKIILPFVWCRPMTIK